MLKKSKLKIKRRNTEPNINVLVNNMTNANESNSTLDPDAESEFWDPLHTRRKKTMNINLNKRNRELNLADNYIY